MNRFVFEKIILGWFQNGIVQGRFESLGNKVENIVKFYGRDDRGYNKCSNNGDEEVDIDRGIIRNQKQQYYM